MLVFNNENEKKPETILLLELSYVASPRIGWLTRWNSSCCDAKQNTKDIIDKTQMKNEKQKMENTPTLSLHYCGRVQEQRPHLYTYLHVNSTKSICFPALPCLPRLLLPLLSPTVLFFLVSASSLSFSRCLFEFTCLA